MATAASDELKEALMARGIWPDFVRRRADVRLERGCTSRDAIIGALEEMAPDLLGMVKRVGRPRKKADFGEAADSSRNTPSPSQKDDPPKNMDSRRAPEFRGESATASKPDSPSKPKSLADVKRRARDSKYSTKRGVADEGSVVVTKEMFAGKTCSISTAFMWAYSNLCFADACPEDAPSAVAWQMFVDMKTSPSLKADMLKSGLGAAMRKAEAEESTGERFDGEKQYDLLGAIVESQGNSIPGDSARDGAEGGAQ